MDEMNDKEDFDSMEWKLFELLEGNLSVREETALMAQIEADHELKEEWELMKATIVPKPALVFSSKDKLKKPGKKIIPLWTFMNQEVVKYAAAIIGFALIAYPIWKFADPQNSTDSLVNTFQESISEPKNISPNTLNTDEVQEHHQQKELETARISESHKEGSKVIVNPHKEVIPDVLFIVEKERIKIRKSQRHQDTVLDSNASLEDLQIILASAHPNSNVSFPESSEEINKVIPVNAGISYPVETYVAQNDYRGIRNSLNTALFAMGAPVRNTKVRFKRAGKENKPVIQIAYLGENYQAMAMLELKR